MKTHQGFSGRVPRPDYHSCLTSEDKPESIQWTERGEISDWMAELCHFSHHFACSLSVTFPMILTLKRLKKIPQNVDNY